MHASFVAYNDKEEIVLRTEVPSITAEGVTRYLDYVLNLVINNNGTVARVTILIEIPLAMPKAKTPAKMLYDEGPNAN